MSFDQIGRVAELCGERLELSARELSLLEMFLQRPGRLVDKNRLVEHLCEWGEEVSTNAIEVYVHRLRKKLEIGGSGFRRCAGSAIAWRRLPREVGRLKSASPKRKPMSEFQSKGQRFVALCMLGVLLFNYPILALFNVSGTVFGVPVLYAYIFIAWAALIALMAWVAESDARHGDAEAGACCTARPSSSRRSPTSGCCSRSPTTPTSAPTRAARSSRARTSTACRSRSTRPPGPSTAASAARRATASASCRSTSARR